MNGTLEHLLGGGDLDEREADALLTELADPAFDPAVAGAVLAALRAKGETADEVRGFARGMRRLATRPAIRDDVPAIDIVGTGGDHSGSLNVSTGAALLTAACGQPVVKHGNGSISSRSGSADVLAALGFDAPTDGEQAGRCLDMTGFTFLFAPFFHPAMKAIGPVRRRLGIRTIFNILGPLTNPAGPPYYLLGAFSSAAAELMANALAGLPIRRGFVVHGSPGWDEPTPVGPFEVYDVRPGAVHKTERDPADYGFPPCNPEDLAGGTPAENAARLTAALGGTPGADHDAIVLNASLALEITGRCADPVDAIRTATAAIEDGTALRLLEQLVAFSNAPEEAGRV